MGIEEDGGGRESEKGEVRVLILLARGSYYYCFAPSSTSIDSCRLAYYGSTNRLASVSCNLSANSCSTTTSNPSWGLMVRPMLYKEGPGHLLKLRSPSFLFPPTLFSSSSTSTLIPVPRILRQCLASLPSPRTNRPPSRAWSSPVPATSSLICLQKYNGRAPQASFWALTLLCSTYTSSLLTSLHRTPLISI